MDKLDLRQAFFHAHPDPMWIYDIATLAFLDVNAAAERKYGWSRAEFLAMSLEDIRPAEDIEKLRAQIDGTTDAIDTSGVWRYLTRAGRMVFVDVVSHELEYGGRAARFVSARDVTRLVELERERTAMLESISDGFFTLDAEDRFTFLNGQAEAYLDRPRAELLGRNVWEAFPEARDKIFKAAVETAVERRQTQRFTEYLDPPGRWFQSAVHPADNGGVTVYFRDVTAERAAETQLRLLEQAVSHLNDVVLITEANPIEEASGGPRVVYVNDAFVRTTGYEKAEIIGRTPRLLQGADTSQAEVDRIRDALARGESVRAELVNYTRHGAPFWVEMDIVPIALDGVAHTHFVSVQRDITERRTAQEAMRLGEERFQLMARATNDVVWDWDIARDALWWNSNLQDLFGYSPAQDLTPVEFWSQHTHPDDRDRVQAGFTAALESSQTIWRAEYRFQKADGRYAAVADRGFIIRDDAGRPTRAVGSMLDVTERRELEESVRQSQKLEAIGQLTGGVAHDFNNLLTVILNNAEGLEEALADQPSLKDLASMTIQAAERGAELTSRLLAVARRQALKPTNLDLGTLVRNLRPLLRRTLSEDIEIEIVAPANLWLVEADSGQVEVALLNLAINARDAMSGGGKLTLRLDNVGEGRAPPTGDLGIRRPCVRLAVSDTGQGMPKAVLSRAFEPFFTTKPVGKGSGLGLSMVYGFIKQTGGEARIRSAPGKGATVELFFPSLARGTSATPVPARPRLGKGGCEHIMVVEDDAFVRENLTVQLRALGYRVTTAEGAAEALAGLPDDIDLLFTDVVMPGGMNGRDLAIRALTLRPGLRVLFTSGYSRDALLTEGRLPPGVQLLGKPYRRHELADKVREVLDAEPLALA
ncbi:MAG: PAS domain S-box protein [Alphaproteobacteria bacterium]|nr:PAS domain S-box protein [Alphaproteobacteria bacterium]MBU1525344.1 PAS domain S-box protein [Alphaproteobacteria bacterium]MBU2352299.1 PAS domain S-box protein [Alphaproteobacteria bacterium]MBU2381657.1 PAS domain S-box protein [Alphaproteobacteria bacterium]